MYYLVMWDKDLASVGQDGCLDKVGIPLDVANFFFKLDVEQFPILSNLSFDDYDMFSDSQIDSLVGELLAAASLNPPIFELVKLMVKFILKAKSLRKNVLFDPFRAN
ncbi:hypothetical protein [Pseudomonas sp. G2-4]|uniref:hypothetical protein n=1 Tax=Pseudomonas sp. G2-4 TaxID=1506334 RepID=UPI0024BB45C3|nr:hypothetical protein [Pseudomonas sp. G2-4]WHS59040.1 hypothetical protein QNH97_21675 [Pseudomonas sp. G2-4]